MKSVAALCLALCSTSAALSQQPIEWRPTVADDNKAASWADTSVFIANSLKNSSANSLTPAVYGPCRLDVASHSDTEPVGLALRMRDHNKVEISSIQVGSFAERIGLEVGMQFLGVKVNGRFTEVAENPTRLEEGDLLFERNLHAGDRLLFTVQTDHTNERLSKVSRNTWNAEGALAASEGYMVDFAKVDPLSVIVRGTGVISFSGSLNGVFASTVDLGSTPITQPIHWPMTNLEEAKRTARAVMHAALICGGTKAVSPF